MYMFSKRSRSVLDTVHPTLQHIFEEAITDSPLDFGIPSSGGKRTAEEQNELYGAGKSKADGFIIESSHQKGLAIDIYAYVDGKASWDKKHLTLIAGHVIGTAKRLGYEIEWGGNWHSFVDLPHFQIEE